ncbi:efflux RND transporter permease subunit [Breznakiellaceae bacterium SP9]
MRGFFKHPWLIVGGLFAITAFFAVQLPKAQLDNNNFRFVPDEEEAKLISNKIDDTFGSSQFILIGLSRRSGTVFDAEFLRTVRAFVTTVETIDMIDECNSIVSSAYISGDAESILSEDLLPEDSSYSAEEVRGLKKRLLSWDMYKRVLISDDFSATQILVPLDTSSDNAGDPLVIASYRQVRDLAHEMFDSLADVYVTGSTAISSTINESVQADLVLLVPLVILVVLLVLFFSFRRFTPVVLPLLTVVVAVIWSVGAMPLVGVKLSVISTVLPVILVAVGSAYGIHVVTHYMDDLKLNAVSMDKEAHLDLVLGLLKRIGKAVFLAALTTFAGFVSFCFTSIAPIKEFGIFASFGVLVSFLIAVTFIPALLLIRGPKQFHERKSSSIESSGEDPLSTAIADTFTQITNKRRFVLILTGVIVAISLYGVSNVIIDNVFVEYFREYTDISRSDAFIREKFGGSKVLSVVLEAPPEVLLHPKTLVPMDTMGKYLLERVPNTGKVMGFPELVKRINQVFNADESPDGLKVSPYTIAHESPDFDDFGFDDFDDFTQESADPRSTEVSIIEETPTAAPLSAKELFSLFEDARNNGSSRGMGVEELLWQLKRQVNYEGASYYEIPESPERYGKTDPQELQQIVSNYLTLLSANIDDYANDPLEPTAIKTTVQLRTLGDKDTSAVITQMRTFAADNFPEEVSVTIGGTALVESALNRLVVQSQLTSVITSLVIVFIIISASNRSLAAGVVGIVPLSISILINFAVMGFLGIKLNIGTSMVASVSVGIGIDYTIHYMESYKREYRKSGGKGDYLRRTFLTSGKAIFINAVSVGAGFAVLLLSQFVILADLGLLIALTMGTSALVSLTVIPIILLLFKLKFVGA